MEARINYTKLPPEPVKALFALGHYLAGCGLEHPLLELVKVRASQINGCACCIDMHTQDARAAGESEQRLYALSAWRETPFFTDRERAALAFVEAPREAYDEAAAHFTPDEMGALVSLVVTINAWNTIGVSTQAWLPGSYQS